MVLVWNLWGKSLSGVTWPKGCRYLVLLSISCLIPSALEVCVCEFTSQDRLVYVALTNKSPTPQPQRFIVASIPCPFHIGYCSTSCHLIEQPLPGTLGCCSRGKRNTANHLPALKASVWPTSFLFTFYWLKQVTWSLLSPSEQWYIILLQRGTLQRGAPEYLLNKLPQWAFTDFHLTIVNRK